MRRAFELVDRSRRAEPGRVQRRVRAGQPVDQPDRTPTISRPSRSPSATSPRPRRCSKEAGVTGTARARLHGAQRARKRARSPRSCSRWRPRRGFDLKIRVTEFATSLKQAEDGDYQLYLIGWSGRSDPDGNSFVFQDLQARRQNNGRLLRQGRRRLHMPWRAPRAIPASARRPTRRSSAKNSSPRASILYLYHRQVLVALTRQGRGLQADARRPGARGRREAEVSGAHLPHPAAAADHPDADPRCRC